MNEHRLKKGRKKTGGRKKGSVNKNTKVASKIIDYVLEKGGSEEGFNKLWNQLKPKEQMEFILKILPFERAQLARVENENKLPQSITINMIPAQKEQKQIDNTINIEHEEIDD